MNGLFFKDAPVFSNMTKSVNVADYITRLDYPKDRTFANMGLGHKPRPSCESILGEHILRALV